MENNEEIRDALLEDKKEPLGKQQIREQKRAARKLSRRNRRDEKKKAGSLWAAFKAFITRGNVVDMAIGVTVAGAFTAIVTAFTKGFISPLVALITGGFSLADLKWVVREAADEVVNETGEIVVPAKAEVAFLYGSFLQAVIDFLIIAAVLFAVLRTFTYLSAQSKKIKDELERRAKKDELEAAEAKAAVEAAQAKAAAEAKAAADAKAAAEAARAEQEKEDRARREEELLREIRDLLKNR